MDWPAPINSPYAGAIVPGRQLIVGSVLSAVLCAGALLATSPALPMVWDEGNAILRAGAIARGSWPYTTEVEGHPALYGILIALGQRLAPPGLGPLDAARFGPIVVFGLAAGAMFYRMGRAYGRTAAAGAVAALMLMPRMFAHAHFAGCDGPLTASWILAWATWAPAIQTSRHTAHDHTATLPTGAETSLWSAAFARAPWIVLWGMALGLTLSAKATGWIAPLPFLVWALAYRRRAAIPAAAVGMPVALATFFVLNPPLWADPLSGWLTFFRLNLQRGEQWNIPILFLGQMHHLENPLPWYNTLFWTAITVPTGILVLAVVGLAHVARRWRSQPAGVLLVLNWLVLLLARALPGVPVHDGVRLFLPSFAFLAALAGVGCGAIVNCLPPTWAIGSARVAGQAIGNGAGWRRWTGMAAAALLYMGSASSLFWYAPQWLSYYNLLIGGLRGASAAGMEPTYYWDGLDREVLTWLNEHTAPDEKVRFGASSPENLALLQQWGILRFAAREEASGRFRWYVLQRRPSGLRPADQWLIGHAPAAYRKTIRAGGYGPWRMDVPIVEVYDDRHFLDACRATGD